MYHSTLGSRVIKKKKRVNGVQGGGSVGIEVSGVGGRVKRAWSTVESVGFGVSDFGFGVEDAGRRGSWAYGLAFCLGLRG